MELQDRTITLSSEGWKAFDRWAHLTALLRDKTSDIDIDTLEAQRLGFKDRVVEEFETSF